MNRTTLRPKPKTLDGLSIIPHASLIVPTDNILRSTTHRLCLAHSYKHRIH